MPAKAEPWIHSVWYGRSPIIWLLLPFSWLFFLIVRLRTRLYKLGLLKVTRFDVPVIIIGNITVGGTGKTPITMWLCQELRKRGFKPGIVSRGHGGQIGRRPAIVFAASDPIILGDEAVLMAKRTSCPVVVHPDRVAATRTLLELDVDIVLADDGLQHHRLGRDYEIAVVDGSRGFGNGYMIPAGPLREPKSRLKRIDQVMEQIGLAEKSSVFRRHSDSETTRFRLVPSVARSLDGSRTCSLADFSGQKLHAVAAIGNPDRFFNSLETFGLKLIKHPLRDHAALSPADVTFGDDCPVIMTEKDAVKCRDLDAPHCWYVPVDVEFADPRGALWLDSLLQRIATRAQQAKS